MVMRTGFSAALCAVVITALLATGYLIGPRGWDERSADRRWANGQVCLKIVRTDEKRGRMMNKGR